MCSSAVEQWTFNPVVIGSIPFTPKIWIMLVTDYLQEIKIRAFCLVFSFLLCFSLCLMDLEVVLFLFIRSLCHDGVASFMFTHPLKGLQASLFCHLMLCCVFCGPLVCYQLWAFIVPSLFQHEKAEVTKGLSLFLLFIGISVYIFYIIVFPKGYDFFLSFQNPFVRVELRILDYLKFFWHFCGLFLGCLACPILFFIVCSVIKLRPKQVELGRPWVFLFCVLLAGFVSPPEVVTQLCVGLLFFIIYEILMLSFWIFYYLEVDNSDPKYV